MRFLAALILPTIFALFAPQATAAPFNDNRAGASVLPNANLVRIRGQNFNSTREAGDAAFHYRNVWYRWTAPVTASTVFDVFAFYDSTIAVYAAGPGNSLFVLGFDDDGGDGLNSQLTLPVAAGTTYYIAVDGFVGRQGPFTLQIAQTLGSFDGFATAPQFESETFKAIGTTTGFTLETGEPIHGALAVEAGASAWIKWVAPSRTRVELDTIGSNFDTVLAVYEGDALATLRRVTSNNDVDSKTTTSAVTFDADSEVTYYFAVAGVEGRQGTFNVNFSGSPLRPGIRVSSRNVTVYQGDEAVIIASVSATGPVALQWERSPRGSKTWTALAEDENYSGVDTTELHVLSPQLANDGDRFRLRAEDDVGLSHGPVVTLTVTEFPPVLTEVLGTVSFDLSQGNVPAPSTEGVYFAVGLPKGLTLDTETGVISGVVTAKPGTYRVLYGSTDGRVRNSPQFIVQIVVAAFSPPLTGSFEALLNSTDSNVVPSGKLSLKVAKNGRYTGSYFVLADGRAYGFRGTVSLDQVNRTAGTAVDEIVPISRGRNRSPLGLAFTLFEPSADNSDSFTVLAADVSTEDTVVAQAFDGAAVNPFASTDTAPWAGAYTLRLSSPTLLVPDGEIDLPLGSGFATSFVAPNGSMSLRGRLPDKTAFTAKLAASPSATYRLARRMHATGGSLSGRIELTTEVVSETVVRYRVDSEADSRFYWVKPPRPRDRLYPAGFGSSPVTLTLNMEPWSDPLGDIPASLGLEGDFKINIVAVVPQDSNSSPIYGLPVDVELGLTGRLTFIEPSTNTTKFKLTINSKTGAFSGSYQLAEPASPDTRRPLVRKVAFQGVLLQRSSVFLGDVIGDGFATVPPVDSGEGTTSALIQFLAGAPASPFKIEEDL